MHLMRLFFKRITDDLKQKKLIPLKLLFFVHISTLFVLYPYLTIHMRELGINVEETAIMSAVTPVVAIVMPPLAGMLADKIGNFRYLLAWSSVLGGVSALLLLAVPVGRFTLTFPSAVDLLITCEGSALRLEHAQEHLCTQPNLYAYDANLTLLSCGFICSPTGVSQDVVEHSTWYDVHVESRIDSQRYVFRNTFPLGTGALDVPTNNYNTSRMLQNIPLFNSSISRISKNRLFFPTPQFYQIKCTHEDNNASCTFRNILGGDSDEYNSGKHYLVRVSRNAESNVSYWIDAITSGDSTALQQQFDGVRRPSCDDGFRQESGEKVWVRAGSTQYAACSPACAVTAPRVDLCDNPKQQVEIDPTFTFWTYLSVRVFIGIIGGTAFAMFEGAVIAIVRDQKADYGLQRLYGSIGGMITSPISGLLIDYASKGKSYVDFRPAFYLYGVLKVLSGILMLSIDLEFKQPAHNLVKDVVVVFKNIELLALFAACFVMGTAWGYIESFLFWLLQDLGASRSLMGITITVGGVAGLPLLVLSGPIINKLGHANVLFIGFVFYAIRLLGYSLIYNPWLCLVFEALESVTSSLAFTAAVTYAARLSSTTTDTSVQGLLGGLYYGVGKGAGSLIGGYLMKFIGTRPTYQVFAAATLVTGCIYYLFNKFFIGKRTIVNEIDIYKTKPSDTDCESNKTRAKGNTTETQDATRMDDKILSSADQPKVQLSDTKMTEHVDGGSDSGVDNLPVSENDTDTTSCDTKTDEGKYTV